MTDQNQSRRQFMKLAGVGGFIFGFPHALTKDAKADIVIDLDMDFPSAVIEGEDIEFSVSAEIGTSPGPVTREGELTLTLYIDGSSVFENTYDVEEGSVITDEYTTQLEPGNFEVELIGSAELSGPLATTTWSDSISGTIEVLEIEDDDDDNDQPIGDDDDDNDQPIGDDDDDNDQPIGDDDDGAEPDSDDDDNDVVVGDVDDDDGFGPGFGIPAAVASIGGAGYVLQRRISRKDNS